MRSKSRDSADTAGRLALPCAAAAQEAGRICRTAPTGSSPFSAIGALLIGVSLFCAGPARAEADADRGTAGGGVSAAAPDEADVLRKSCVNAARAYTDMADRFSADPGAFLAGYAERGSSVAMPVRNVLVVKPSAIDSMIDQVKRLAPEDDLARQIALGMGQAALLCARTAPQVALLFQQKFLAVATPLMREAFLAATGDLRPAAIGPGAAPAASPPAPGPSALRGNPRVGTFGPGTEGGGVRQRRGPGYDVGPRDVSVIFSDGGSGGSPAVNCVSITVPVCAP